MSNRRTLLITDRTTGEQKRIVEGDEHFAYSIGIACKSLLMHFDRAMAMLERGEELVTPGFIRKFEAK